MTLDNCENPMEGTEAYLTCNKFYEEVTLEANPKRLCRKDGWDGTIPQCYLICGVKRTKESVNTEKDQNKYPWHVGIYNSRKKFLCGGSLIAMNIVLTATHCVYLYSFDSEIENDETYFVASGKYYVKYDDNRDKFAQHLEVDEVHILPEYQNSLRTNEFDLAILVLAGYFLPSQVVQPVCFSFDPPAPSSRTLLQDRGIITGWGSTSYKSREPSEKLKVFNVLDVPYSQCFVNNNYTVEVYFDKVCGYLLDNETILSSRDSGGGLVFKNKINDRYYLTSILSRCHKAYDFTCEPNQYRLYTSISQFENFLSDYTENIAMKSCILPEHPSHGEYVLRNANGTLPYKFGHPVPTHSRLTLICNAGYNFTSPDATQYYCSINGQWDPYLTGCTSMNKNVSDQTILLSDKPTTFNYNYVIVIVLVLAIFLALVAIILYKLKYKQEWELRKEMKLAGLNRFHNGNLKRFNPELEIGDQAELLPYNNNFEFPRDKVKLGKQLGSGAFGIVMQADAFGIMVNEKRTTVAVKMVKNVADHMHIKMLISELKIMVHLGQHLNVVNLLGACTKNITKRELLVIVEYCQFGNLYDYLLLNRKNYINQIDTATGNIDYSLRPKDLTNLLAVPDNSISVPNSKHKALESITPICTKELISWSFQVARGMEYLASRKILHGDLAARNILLAENNIVKICDFGLAKRMFQSANYKKQQNSPLPIKWMAIESIRDRVFSTQSDVWSFGIVLWELFSLAETPYPGMEADERLYSKLLDGYKMESPPYAPKEMYNIMCDCWSSDPTSRPSFNELAGRVGLLLEVNVRQHYIDLNDPYFVMNTQRLNDNRKDYLLMLNPSGSRQILNPNSYIDILSPVKNDQPVAPLGNVNTKKTINPAMNKTANIPNHENVPSLTNEYPVEVST